MRRKPVWEIFPKFYAEKRLRGYFSLDPDIAEGLIKYTAHENTTMTHAVNYILREYLIDHGYVVDDWLEDEDDY